MSAPSKKLGGETSPPSPSKTPVETLDSDFVVILAALPCALICVPGLVAVARCAWIRRLSEPPSHPRRSAANKGLKKKVLKALPKQTYGEDAEQAGKLSDCAICLAEFVAGEEIRVLPQCAHGFHVGCIDTWLGSHSSCPLLEMSHSPLKRPYKGKGYPHLYREARIITKSMWDKIYEF